MIKPIINEVFPSTGILLRNKYIDSYRRAYFINKIYDAGIKNIEIGSFNKDQPLINGIHEISTNINSNIYKGGLIKKHPIHKGNINQIIFPMYTSNNENIRVRGLSIDQSIEEFNKHKKEAINKGVITKLVLDGSIETEFPYIYNNTQPDIVEVSSINNIILKYVDDVNRISVRPSSLEEIDKAYHECIYMYSSSILNCDKHIETIKLIKHLQSKLGIELPVSITMLSEVQKEIMDEFNW
jgi:hypothetical protein